MKKRNILLALGLMCCGWLSAAEDGKQILDKAADKIAGLGDACVQFRAAMLRGGKEQSRIEGRMLLQDARYQLDTPEMKVWYDGQLQWTLIPGSHEVNLTQPTAQELMTTHPYSFLSIYKEGYDIRVSETSTPQPAYEVRLLAQKKTMPLQEAIVEVNAKDYTVSSIRVRQGKDWQHITLSAYQGGLKYTLKDFTFDPAQYPDYEIIDLR